MGLAHTTLLPFPCPVVRKAVAGFVCDPVLDPEDQFIPVATGNWGCGAFGGDKHLKSLQQWIASSLVGRQVLVPFLFCLIVLPLLLTFCLCAPLADEVLLVP